MLSEVLGAYRPVGATEGADVRRVTDALDTGELFARTSPLHATGSALVVHPASQRVLLRWHTKMEQWMQVGGHFDPGETHPLQVALREGFEETGLDDLRPVATAPGPVQIVIVPVPAHGDEGAHEHADFRYVFVTDRPDAIREESNAARLRWMSFPTAGAETREPNLRTFLTRALATIS
jgi:8-oxo-dGTP pyrophosphatase MutT (NUDIX family)